VERREALELKPASVAHLTPVLPLSDVVWRSSRRLYSILCGPADAPMIATW
jgi:hypothetical protein